MCLLFFLPTPLIYPQEVCMEESGGDALQFWAVPIAHRQHPRNTHTQGSGGRTEVPNIVSFEQWKVKKRMHLSLTRYEGCLKGRRLSERLCRWWSHWLMKPLRWRPMPLFIELYLEQVCHGWSSAMWNDEGGRPSRTASLQRVSILWRTCSQESRWGLYVSYHRHLIVGSQSHRRETHYLFVQSIIIHGWLAMLGTHPSRQEGEGL